MTQTIAIVDLADEAATVAFAEDVAASLAVGDVIALSGGLGAGKTTFARALIRALADDARLEVPSPTFTLVQGYDTGRTPVTHFDLYRLAAAQELEEIGLTDAISTSAVVLEWPDRADGWLPDDRLEIAFEISGQGRRVTVTGGGSWRERLARSRSVRSFLDRNGWFGAGRRYLQGDASTRVYERIRQSSRQAVLMDWPPTGAALPVGDSRAIFRARDIRAFAAVDEALRAVGLSAPEIYAGDLAEGFALMEDFGTEGIVAGPAPIAERYRAALEVLAVIHGEARPFELRFSGGTHRLPMLAADALTAEMRFFVDWYPRHVTGESLSAAARADFDSIWAALFADLADVEQSWVLFDMQSPNLFWLEERKGPARVGLIDFQDMFFGPSAYDVASLCQDARVTVPSELELALREHYVALRRVAGQDFDVEAFSMAYAILGTLRTFKNLGLFARLAERVGRPEYLGHIPRLREYLGRNFAHPVLSALALWYEEHLIPGERAPR